jgi:hypothetical protein
MGRHTMFNGPGLYVAIFIGAGFVAILLLFWGALKVRKLLANRGRGRPPMRSGDRDAKNATREVDASELIQRIRNEITNSEARLRQHVTSEIRGLATILRGREVSSVDKTRLASDIESPVQPRSDDSQPELGGRSNQKSDGPSTIVESPTEEICRLYQDGADALRSKFQLIQFGILNPGDLKESVSARPSFGPTKEGSCWLIQTNGLNCVIPLPGAVFTPDQYGLGGMKNLFECRGYEKGNRYQKVVLIQPAVFRLQGESYQLSRPGIIELKEGEPDR